MLGTADHGKVYNVLENVRDAETSKCVERGMGSARSAAPRWVGAIRVGRQVRELYVVIENPRRLVKALEFFDHFKVKVRGISDSTKHVQGVVVLDSYGRKYLADNNIPVNGYVVDIDVQGLEKGIAMAIICSKTLMINPLKRLIVGIDYGKNIGVAVIANDDVVYTGSYRSAEEAVNDIGFFVYNVESEVKIIRIGIAQDIDENFANTIVERFKDVAHIEFVPEYKSSRHKYMLEDTKLATDEIAAINIAFYRSKEVT